MYVCERKKKSEKSIKQQLLTPNYPIRRSTSVFLVRLTINFALGFVRLGFRLHWASTPNLRRTGTQNVHHFRGESFQLKNNSISNQTENEDAVFPETGSSGPVCTFQLNYSIGFPTKRGDSAIMGVLLLLACSSTNFGRKLAWIILSPASSHHSLSGKSDGSPVFHFRTDQLRSTGSASFPPRGD